MKQWLIIFLIALGVSVTPGCDYTEALMSEGEMISKEYDVEPFGRLILESSVRLVIENDSVYSIKAEALDFIIPRLQIVQDGNIIKVESSGLIGFRKKQMPVLHITSPDLHYIRSNYPNEIVSEDTVKIDRLSIIVNGRGAFTSSDLTVDANYIYLAAFGGNVGTHKLRGKAKSLKVVSEGLTFVDAGDLVAEEALFLQRSVNAGHVCATKKLKIEMLSSGNVYYSGPADTTIIMGDPLYKVKLGDVIDVSE